MFVVYSFVRFVSTPEILERVYTIESEILQIEEAISIQGNNDILVSIHISIYHLLHDCNIFLTQVFTIVADRRPTCGKH